MLLGNLDMHWCYTSEDSWLASFRKRENQQLFLLTEHKQPSFSPKIKWHHVKRQYSRPTAGQRSCLLPCQGLQRVVLFLYSQYIVYPFFFVFFLNSLSSYFLFSPLMSIVPTINFTDNRLCWTRSGWKYIWRQICVNMYMFTLVFIFCFSFCTALLFFPKNDGGLV